MTTEAGNAGQLICAAKLTIRHENMFLVRQSLECLSKADGYLGASIAKDSYTLTVYVRLEAFQDLSNAAIPRDCEWCAVPFDLSSKESN